MRLINGTSFAPGSRRRGSARPFWQVVGAAAALAALLLSGCGQVSAAIITTVAEASTPGTPNPTLQGTFQAVSAMLTGTAAAPTTTLTPLVTATASPTATITPPVLGSSQKPGRVGETLKAQGVALTVLSVSESKKLGKIAPQPGDTLLVVDVIIENTSNAEQDYNPLYFTVNAGASADTAMLNAAFPELLNGTLGPGEWVRGLVAFETRASTAKMLRLRYQPQTAAGRPDMWIDLGAKSAEAPAVPATGASSEFEALPGRGQRVEVKGLALTIGQVTASRRIGYTKAGAGNVLVDAEVFIQNLAHTKAPYNPEYFRVKGASGYEYRSLVIPLNTLLEAGSLQRGQQASGHVVFEIPEDEKVLVVKYQPQVLTGEFGEIRVRITVPPVK